MNIVSSEIMNRCSSNPVLHMDCIPWDCMSVFNAGICKKGEEYIMLFRTDSGPKANPDPTLTRIGLARSQNGIDWQVQEEPVFDRQKMYQLFQGRYAKRFGEEELSRLYDPRLSFIDDKYYLCAATDTRHGIRGLVAQSDNLVDWEILNVSIPENRNMVLFPERVNGKLVRLERPFPLYFNGGKESFDIWCSTSLDGKYWGEHNLLLGAEEVPYANSKIGPGAPPVKTEKGWLTAFHAVINHPDRPLKTWSPAPWTKEYVIGLMLLDLDAPEQVIGMMREPLMRAEASYEVEGFRGSVLFPGGLILEDSGEVKLYYGAADTHVALATASVDSLLSAIEPF